MSSSPNFALFREPLGRLYIKQGRYVEAVSEFEKDVAVDRTAYSLSNLGYANAAAGRREKALAIVKELEEKYNRREAFGQYVALVHLGFADLDQTFAWLEKDFRSRAGFMTGIMVNPLFDSIRSDSRYASLMSRIGIKHWKQ